MFKLAKLFGGHQRTLGTFLFRIGQLGLALAVIAYYGQYVNKGDRKGVPADAKWVYAVSTGSIAAFTYLVIIIACLFHTQYRAIALLWPWEFVLMVMWAAVFGIFGMMYIHEKPEMDEGIIIMKRAVWIDAFSWGMSLLSCGYGVWIHLSHRQGSESDFAIGREKKQKRRRVDVP